VKLPQSFLDEALSRTDIIDIISARITLKKTGQANYQALCPFHQEKSPSFSVSQSKQFYYCFGCKASGNAINFLMAYDKLPFLDAVEILASQAGLAMPEHDAGKIMDHAPSLTLLDQCANYYQAELDNHQAAKNYLQNRGVDAEVITTFRIGYAPSGWQNLLNAINKKADTSNKLIDTGMVVAKEGKLFDRFRDRIIFPIQDKRGQVIAFGGRSLDEQMPKYLNSPETELFHKSRVLYGLHQVIKSNPDIPQMVVVEGYMDVISLHQYGVTTAVATLGTAISSAHINLLLRLTRHLLFCFDGDKAGQVAAWRALEIALPLMNEGIQIRFSFLPTGEDPDSFIRKQGPQKFNEHLQNAVPLTDFFFQKLQDQTESDSVAGKTRLAHLADKFLQKLPTGIFQELMFQRLANIIGISTEKVNAILKNKPQQPTEIPEIIDTGIIASPLRLAISLLLQRPSLQEQLVIPDSFAAVSLNGAALIRKVLLILNENPKQTTGSLLEYFNEDEKRLLTELAVQDVMVPEAAWQEELQGTFDRIVAMNTEDTVTQLLSKGSRSGLTTEEKILLQQLLSIKK
jgi:DNA primase